MKKKLTAPKEKLKGEQLPLPGIPPTVVPKDREQRITRLMEKKHITRQQATEAIDGAIDSSQSHSPSIETYHASQTARVKVTKDGTKAYFEQGDIRFEVDVKDLNKVVGCNGESSPIDKLMDSEIVALAQTNKLPVQPYSFELLRPVLVGLLQTTWYRDVENHTSDHLTENQSNRVRWYLHGLSQLKNKPVETSSGATRAVRTSNKSSMLSKSYRVVKTDATNVSSGREKALLGVLVNLKTASSFAKIVETAKDSEFKTKQDFEKQVARFLKELISHGAVEEVQS